MFPLRSSERVYSTPAITITLIALNVMIFLYQATLRPYELNAFVSEFGIVPDQMRGMALITLFTSMFLHGGWLHLGGNMLFLWVFGRNVEDLIGGPKFLGLYLAGGLIAGLVQIVANPYSRIPTIGASGAIAAVMGAYLIKFPRSSIVMLFTPLFFFTMDIPAPIVLIYWFALQFISGLWSLGSTDYTGGGVAWFAHVGGFIAGMLLVRLMPARVRWRAWYDGD